MAMTVSLARQARMACTMRRAAPEIKPASPVRETTYAGSSPTISLNRPKPM